VHIIFLNSYLYSEKLKISYRCSNFPNTDELSAKLATFLQTQFRHTSRNADRHIGFAHADSAASGQK